MIVFFNVPFQRWSAKVVLGRFSNGGSLEKFYTLESLCAPWHKQRVKREKLYYRIQIVKKE